MKYIRFYQEFEDEKTRKISSGNVMAVQTDLKGFPKYRYTPNGYIIDGFGAIGFEPNSDVAGTSVNKEWLQQNTKRISEEKARKIHPKLFKYFEN